MRFTPFFKASKGVILGFPGGVGCKEPPAYAGDIEMQVQSQGWEDPLEEGMATHSSISAWRIPWAEKPGRLSSKGCKSRT